MTVHVAEEIHVSDSPPPPLSTHARVSLAVYRCNGLPRHEWGALLSGEAEDARMLCVHRSCDGTAELISRGVIDNPVRGRDAG